MQTLPEWPVNSGQRALTYREKQVWDLVVRGYPNREIASQLCISIKTVEAHKTNIAKKYGITSVRELRNLAVIILLRENEKLKERLELLGIAAEI